MEWREGSADANRGWREIADMMGVEKKDAQVNSNVEQLLCLTLATLSLFMCVSVSNNDNDHTRQRQSCVAPAI